MTRTISVIGIALVVTCCRVPLGAGNPSGPVRLEVDGPYTHAATGFEFPVTAGPFRRIGVTQYDKDATDVSGGYELTNPSTRMSVTLYVYPAPKVTSFGSPDDVVAVAKANVLASHLEGLKAQVLSGHSDAKVVAQERVAIPVKNGDLRGEKIEFQFTTSNPLASFPSSSFLYLFKRGDWLIKIRATGRRDRRDELEKVVGEFVADLAVPATM